MRGRWINLLIDGAGLIIGLLVGWLLARWLGFSIADPNTGAIGGAAIGLLGGAGLALARRWRKRSPTPKETS